MKRLPVPEYFITRTRFFLGGASHSHCHPERKERKDCTSASINEAIDGKGEQKKLSFPFIPGTVFNLPEEWGGK